MQPYEPLLNQLSAFGRSDATAQSVCAAEMEKAAQDIQNVTRIPLMTDQHMSQVAELLETFPPASRATKALLSFLSSLCLADENRIMAVRFGVPSTCVVLLQNTEELLADTLYYIFDLASTLSANDGSARDALRPSIPYIITALERQKDVVDVVLGGAISLSTLSMLNVANCELIIARGGFQTLVNTYMNISQLLTAHRQKKKTKGEGASFRAAEEKDQSTLYTYENTLFWIKDALLKLCHADIPAVDEAIKSANYGLYGQSILMDELKWSLTFERKKLKQKGTLKG
ncbi:hypothetical protein STCU_04318 [Strigomonas culicis]|uniref:Uncharacterized protein n=1 Tax=Strigomonas culicis TaxID=28005 RepID=S9U7Y1_9TRYP|nr:hypothetical protein STCU_06936 [Strigomonas culicis]EPY29935.1 hypothetical protein STCU_04318 [Strigomonas culicis]|eukprot:EPY24924.1 hypothetical protein STCU_06936 [Strigomonas culicis]